MSHLLGKPAPEFSATTVIEEEFKAVSLKDYDSKYLLLFFYPMDFTPVCSSEIAALSKHVDKFKTRGCEVIGVSCDSHFTHLVFAQRLKLETDVDNIIPLMADKSGRIAKDYGVYNEEQGVANRAYFLIDNHKVLREISINDQIVARSVEELLRVLDFLQNGNEKEQNLYFNKGIKRRLSDQNTDEVPIKSSKKSDESSCGSNLH